MKTFYIFKINKMFMSNNDSKISAIYKIFNKIYESFDEELFRKVVVPFDKKQMNNYILSKHLEEFYYYKKNNVHFIDTAFETATLYINNLFIKIESDKILNSFIRDLIDYEDDLFIMDFENKDFFWLKRNKYSKILI